LDCFPAAKDIIEAALNRRDNDCARRIAAFPWDDLARYGLLPENIEKVSNRPAVNGVKIGQLEGAKRIVKGESRRPI
jgi:hypothetical protein